MDCIKNSIWNSSTGPHNLSDNEKLSIMEVLDHLHVTRQYQEMGSCTVCKKISIKKCSACGTFYCSSECQTFDWPKHRISCSKSSFRNIGSDQNSFTLSRRMNSSVKSFNEDNVVITKTGSPFTALTNHIKKNSGKIFTENKGSLNLKIANKQYQIRTPLSKHNETFANEGKDFKKLNLNDRKKYNEKKLRSTKKSSPEGNQRKNLNNASWSEISNSEESEQKSKNQKTPPIQFEIEKAKVIGTFRESPKRYWVMYEENIQKYEQIQNILNTKCFGYESVTPKVGSVYGCTFADEWFRGKVIALTPKIVVHFIDFGNTANYDVKIFKKLPDNLASIPGLVFLIEFEEGTPEQYETKDLDFLNITIEETSKTADGIPRVKILSGAFGVTKRPFEKKNMTNEKSINRRSVMDTITSSTNGMLFFLPGESLTRFASLVPDNNKQANDCIEKVLSIVSTNSVLKEAREGEFVLVTDKEGNDQRGLVLSVLDSTYKVQLIDCGNVISTDKVFSLPDDLVGLIELGVKVTFDEIFIFEQLKKLENCFFNVSGPAVSGKWPCILKGTEQQIIAKVYLEKPSETNEWKPSYVSLKSGSTVEISSFTSSKFFYVRSVDAETEQKFLDMNMEIIQQVQKMKNLPVFTPGTLCCAENSDRCYYRAIVKSVEDEKVNIFFVDFGIEQKLDFKDVKPLPDSVKNIPFFAVKVKLKGFSHKSWNNMIREYLTKLWRENVELIMTYENSIDDGVILQEKVSGVVINDFIEKVKDKEKKNALITSKSLKKSEIFLDDDLKYTTVPVGSVCILALLYVNELEFETSCTFWATVAGVDNFNYVNGELSSLISHHCDGVSEPYEPSFRELCLAEFEDCWYRAMCVGNENEVFKIFFVDFGNFCELKSSSIRKMPKDFMEAPALAMNCSLSGFERLKKNSQLSKKISAFLLKKLNTLISNVTVLSFKEDTYQLRIPEIEALMVE